MTATPVPFPGPGAGADEVLCFAEAYRASALGLLEGARGRGAIERAPGRFCAVHAIELYLDAFLRGLGVSPCQLRAHGHNLQTRVALAVDCGLVLRRKTRLHLVQLTRDREYLVLRYGPGRPGSVSELNRLTASLEEIARKVRAAVAALTPDRVAAA